MREGLWKPSVWGSSKFRSIHLGLFCPPPIHCLVSIVRWNFPAIPPVAGPQWWGDSEANGVLVPVGVGHGVPSFICCHWCCSNSSSQPAHVFAFGLTPSFMSGNLYYSVGSTFKSHPDTLLLSFHRHHFCHPSFTSVWATPWSSAFTVSVPLLWTQMPVFRLLIPVDWFFADLFGSVGNYSDWRFCEANIFRIYFSSACVLHVPFLSLSGVLFVTFSLTDSHLWMREFFRNPAEGEAVWECRHVFWWLGSHWHICAHVSLLPSSRDRVWCL